MDDLKKQIDAARSEGYKDDEIMQYLSSMPDIAPQIQKAVESNYTPGEILNFLSTRKSAAFEAGAKKSELEKGFYTAMQGPTMGFYDELAGAVAAPIKAITEGKPLSQAYQEQRDLVRGATEDYIKAHPYRSIGLQAAASLPTMFASLPTRATQAVSKAVTPTIEAVSPAISRGLKYLTQTPPTGQVMGMGQRMAQAGASGVGYGGLYGLGATEEIGRAHV